MTLVLLSHCLGSDRPHRGMCKNNKSQCKIDFFFLYIFFLLTLLKPSAWKSAEVVTLPFATNWACTFDGDKIKYFYYTKYGNISCFTYYIDCEQRYIFPLFANYSFRDKEMYKMLFYIWTLPTAWSLKLPVRLMSIRELQIILFGILGG